MSWRAKTPNPPSAEARISKSGGDGIVVSGLSGSAVVDFVPGVTVEQLCLDKAASVDEEDAVARERRCWPFMCVS